MAAAIPLPETRSRLPAACAALARRAGLLTASLAAIRAAPGAWPIGGTAARIHGK